MIKLTELERTLVGTYKTLREACLDLGIKLEDNLGLEEIEDCANCGIWRTRGLMKADQDGSPICTVCRMYYGD